MTFYLLMVKEKKIVKSMCSTYVYANSLQYSELHVHNNNYISCNIYANSFNFRGKKHKTIQVRFTYSCHQRCTFIVNSIRVTSIILACVFVEMRDKIY